MAAIGGVPSVPWVGVFVEPRGLQALAPGRQRVLLPHAPAHLPDNFERGQPRGGAHVDEW